MASENLGCFLRLRLVKLLVGEKWSARSPAMQFILVCGGAGLLGSAKSVLSVSRGDVLLLHDQPDETIQAGEGGLAFWHFALAFEHLYPLLAGHEFAALSDLRSWLREPRHFAASTDVAQECQRLLRETQPGSDLNHRSQLLRIASVILVTQFNPATPRPIGCSEMDEKLVSALSQLTNEEILGTPIEDLAAGFGLNRRRLNRLFTQHFGLSIVGLRMQLRLFKAAALLRNPQLKICDVAEQCGFHHSGLFNACFKRRFGSTPGQWRKQRTSLPKPVPAGPVQAEPAQSAKLGAHLEAPSGLNPVEGEDRSPRELSCGRAPRPNRAAASVPDPVPCPNTGAPTQIKVQPRLEP